MKIFDIGIIFSKIFDPPGRLGRGCGCGGGPAPKIYNYGLIDSIHRIQSFLIDFVFLTKGRLSPSCPGGGDRVQPQNLQ